MDHLALVIATIAILLVGSALTVFLNRALRRWLKGHRGAATSSL